MRDTILITLCIIISLIIIAGLSCKEMEDERLELELYCEMVKIRKESKDKRLGWPDYKGIYDKCCNE